MVSAHLPDAQFGGGQVAVDPREPVAIIHGVANIDQAAFLEGISPLRAALET